MTFPRSIVQEFPLATIKGAGSAFLKLMETLQGPALRHAVAEKFNLDLTNRPTMVTVRGRVPP
ncbi:MAG: hypothetical protein R3E60_04120 [Alphaproteobacteria bacterium]